MIFPGIKKVRDKFNLTDNGLFVKGAVRNSRIRLCDGRNCKILSIIAPAEISETARKALQKFSEKPFKAKVEIDGNSATFTFREYLWPYSWKKIGEVIEGATKIIYDENPHLPASEEAESESVMEKKAVNIGHSIAIIFLIVIICSRPFWTKGLLSVKFASDFARYANAYCPMQIDEYTRLDSASSRLFKIYLNYTVCGIDLESQDAEIIKETFIKNLRASGYVAKISDQTIWFILNYSDSNGDEIFRITILPVDYK